MESRSGQVAVGRILVVLVGKEETGGVRSTEVQADEALWGTVRASAKIRAPHSPIRMRHPPVRMAWYRRESCCIRRELGAGLPQRRCHMPLPPPPPPHRRAPHLLAPCLALTSRGLSQRIATFGKRVVSEGDALADEVSTLTRAIQREHERAAKLLLQVGRPFLVGQGACGCAYGGIAVWRQNH